MWFLVKIITKKLLLGFSIHLYTNHASHMDMLATLIDVYIYERGFPEFNLFVSRALAHVRRNPCQFTFVWTQLKKCVQINLFKRYQLHVIISDFLNFCVICELWLQIIMPKRVGSGRKKSAVANLFNDIASTSKIAKVECTFCSKPVTKNGSRMLKHIQYCKKCPNTVKEKHAQATPSVSSPHAVINTRKYQNLFLTQ